MVLRILAENAVRTAGEGRDHALEQLRSAARGQSLGGDIPFLPSRLLMHDTTATPALVDVAAMRDALARRGVDPVALPANEARYFGQVATTLATYPHEYAEPELRDYARG